MIDQTLKHTGRLTGFLWPSRRVSGRFQNVGNPRVPGFRDVLRWKMGRGPADTSPHPVTAPIAPTLMTPDLARIEHPKADQISATWIGHSTFLIQVAGFNILTDPIFSEYCSPWPIQRLRRGFPPALAVQELPRIDLIVLSHAHYDHFDRPSIQQMDRRIPIAAPLGLATVLRRWGFTNAVEFDWGDHGDLGELRLSCLPVQHGAARTPFDRNTTLWCGWMLEIAGQKIFFSGDTGYAAYFPELFALFAPVDLALLPIGAYAPDWFMQPLHLNPIEAVQMHRDLGARASIAMHWGTFQLTDEPLGAPPALLCDALARPSIPETDFRIAGIGETTILPVSSG